MLRVAGVRHADMKGYSYRREDVNARALANAYAQTLGQVFTHEMKPYEVEILVAEVGATERGATSCSTSSTTAPSWTSRASRCSAARRRRSPSASRSSYADGLELGGAVKLGATVLAGDGETRSSADQLEVAVLDRARPRRAFRRIRGDELDDAARLSRTVTDRVADAGSLSRDAAAPPATRARDHDHHGSAATRGAAGRAVPRPRARGRVGGVVDLVDEQHVACVVELVGGHVHVDAGEITHREPRTAPVDRRAAATSMPSSARRACSTWAAKRPHTVRQARHRRAGFGIRRGCSPGRFG